MGHDFRPEYRNLRIILEQFKQSVPIIALTATATPKVQEDIMKNLGISNAKILRPPLIDLICIMKLGQKQINRFRYYSIY